MIHAVVIMPAYASEEADLAAQSALSKEILDSLGVNYRSKLQWRDVVILDLEDDPKPYRHLPVLALGAYASTRAKYSGCDNVLHMPGPTEPAFEGCGAFKKFNKRVGKELKWGSTLD